MSNMIKYNKNTGNVCDKCNGFMRFDEDNDLKCMNCGRTIILRKARGNVDQSIRMVENNIRDRYTPNQHSKMVRQRGLFRSRK